MLIAVSFTITALNDFTDNELQEKDNYRITEANSLEMVLTAFLRVRYISRRKKEI